MQIFLTSHFNHSILSASSAWLYYTCFPPSYFQLYNVTTANLHCFFLWCFLLVFPFSFQCNKNPEQNLSEKELVALASLSKTKILWFKCLIKVILLLTILLLLMKNLLSDQMKFESYFEKWRFSKFCSESRKAHRHHF